MILTRNGYWAERAYASKGMFDITALSREHCLLISCRRSKSRIIKDTSVLNANRDTVLKLATLPTPPKTYYELWHYQDRQKGQSVGSWRRYRISGGWAYRVPMLPVPRGKERTAAERQVRFNRDALKVFDEIKMDIEKDGNNKYKISPGLP